MKTVKAFNQKGWDLTLSQTKEDKFQVTLTRDEWPVDLSSELLDYITASMLFDKWLEDLKSIVIKGV